MQESYEKAKERLNKLIGSQSKDANEGCSQEDLDILKAKTREVEELGMKIDETIRTRQDTETLIQRLGAYDADLFDELQNKQHSDSELRKLIHEKTQELEKFPKKSRHGQEWFEKYQKKYEELKAKHSNCSQVLDGMTDLSNNVTYLKEKNLQDTFHGLREAFMETFKFIVP